MSVSAAGTLEVRALNLDKRVIAGYAIIWGEKNSYDEKFVKGCCAKSIREHGPGSNANYQIKMLNEHRRDQALELFAVLREDDIGLYFETNPLPSGPGFETEDRVLEQIRRGILNNFSQGFDYNWNRIEYDDSDDSFVMLEIDLYEISVVSIPAGLNTYAVRSAADLADLTNEIDEFISGLPRNHRAEARDIMARLKSLANLSTPLSDDPPPAPTGSAPTSTGLDINYLLTQNLF